MADRVTARREAAARQLLRDKGFEPHDDRPIGNAWINEGASILAAADEWDRANGYVTVRPNDLRGWIKHAVQHGAFGTRLLRRDAGYITDVVLSVLRESAEREANR